MSHPSTREQQVVVAYDFSGGGEIVLERAIDLVCRAPFHTLHVVTAIHPRYGVAAIPADDVDGIDYRYADRIQAELVTIVSATLAAHHAPHDIHFYTYGRIGKPHKEILRLAEEIGADLIYVGSHNLTGVRRYLVGSTSEHVVRDARCPVIVARAKGYKGVEREHVIEVEHVASHYVPPHRYQSRVDRELTRPNDFPIS